MTLETNIPHADNCAFVYPNIFGIMRYPLDKARNISSVYCPSLGTDAVIHHSTIVAAGRDSLKEFEAVTVEVDQLLSQNSIRRVVTRFNPQLIVPPTILRDHPVTFARSFFHKSQKRCAFVAFQRAEQDLLQAIYRPRTLGVRKYFMNDEELLAQPGDEARATIHLHANERGHAVALLQP